MIPDTYRAAAGFLFHVIRAAEVDQPEQVVGQSWVRFEVRPCGCVGHIDEWHLVLPKSVQHFTFEHASRLSEEGVVLGSPFSETRLVPVWAIGNSV
jgi:hypothetical protein